MKTRAPHTQILSGKEALPLLKGTYLYGSLEERSEHMLGNPSMYQNVNMRQIDESDDGNKFSVDGKDTFQEKTLNSYHSFLSSLPDEIIYLDITGLSHSIWAPILKCLIERQRKFLVVYVEPFDYSRTFSSEQGPIYDLSESIRSVGPIPGLASFVSDEEKFLFVPLLGFEGARFKFMIDNVEPVGTSTFPFIGVPGFRAEYPFYTYQSNRMYLKETGSWKNVIHADANCPFATFLELENLLDKYSSAIKIALIGTKPHSLGAIMFRLAYPTKTEILYDHPIRRKKRTSGVLKKHIYDVMGFFNSSPTHSSLTVAGRLR